MCVFSSPVFSLTWDTYFFTFHSCSCSYGHIKKYVYQAGYMGTWTNVYHSILIIHKYQRLRAKPQRWWTLITVLPTERHTNPHTDASFALLKLYIQFAYKCHRTAQLIFTPHQRSVFFLPVISRKLHGLVTLQVRSLTLRVFTRHFTSISQPKSVKITSGGALSVLTLQKGKYESQM